MANYRDEIKAARNKYKKNKNKANEKAMVKALEKLVKEHRK